QRPCSARLRQLYSPTLDPQHKSTTRTFPKTALLFKVIVLYLVILLNLDSEVSSSFLFDKNLSLIYNLAYDPCHPIIALPTGVRNVDPAWATCLNNGIQG